jgi:HSP20 family protein
MTMLTRWSPITGLAGLEVDRLNRMFDAVFEPFAAGGWTPAADVYETAENDVVVKIDLPAIKREDIKVSLENDVLTIEGERKFATPNKHDKTDKTDKPGENAGDVYSRIERGYGAFRRSFALPSTVDSARVQASYEDGVLTVTLPRREESRARQIQVQG